MKRNEVSLGDTTNIMTGFPFKSAEYVEDSDGIPLVRGDNVVQGTFRWDGVKRWPATRLDDFRDFMLQEKDIVLAMDRPWIEVGLKYSAIRANELPALLVQRTARLRAKPGLDQTY